MSNASPTGGLLPHHLAESTFRFYEPYLTLAVRNFPEETSWDVGTLRATDPSIKIGPNTFIARFRDAIVSLRRFNWETTVDFDKLTRIGGQYSIKLQEGTSIVWFKNRQRSGRSPSFVAEARAVQAAEGISASPVLWRDATREEIEALCLLVSNQRISGPFLADLELPPAVVEEYQSRWNVALTWDGERKVLVVT